MSEMFKASRRIVPGSYREYGYYDTWQESIDIDFDGDLSNEEAQRAVIKTFMTLTLGSHVIHTTDTVSHIDVKKRQLIINCSCNC